MHTIEIEEDVFEYLKSRIVRIGETPSEILRRELGLTRKNGTAPSPRQVSTGGPARSGRTTKIGEFLESPDFLVQANVLERFMAILSWLHKEYPSDYELLLRLFGRKRKYFGKTRDELEQSGSSVMPKRIPNTPYWVVTNTSTETKKTILHKAMSTLRCDQASISVALDALR